MSDSLREQLLKTGLGESLKRSAETKRKAQAKRPRPHSLAKNGTGDSDIDLAKAYALRAHIENSERRRLQREAEQRAREKKEIRDKLVRLLKDQQLNLPDAEIARHFEHRGKIRRIYVCTKQLAKLNAGELGVVQLAGRYLLVQRDIAIAAQQLAPDVLALLCDPEASDQDDVPSDLVW